MSRQKWCRERYCLLLRTNWPDERGYGITATASLENALCCELESTAVMA